MVGTAFSLSFLPAVRRERDVAGMNRVSCWDEEVGVHGHVRSRKEGEALRRGAGRWPELENVRHVAGITWRDARGVRRGAECSAESEDSSGLEV